MMKNRTFQNIIFRFYVYVYFKIGFSAKKNVKLP